MADTPSLGQTIAEAAASANPVTAIGALIMKGIGMFKLSPEIKAQLQAQLVAENLDMEKAQLAADLQRAQMQADINKQEAASTKWFIAGARPAVIWVCVTALAYSFVVQPFAQFILAACHVNILPLPVLNTGDLVAGLLVPLLGLSGMRTVEKVQDVVHKH